MHLCQSTDDALDNTPIKPAKRNMRIAKYILFMGFRRASEALQWLHYKYVPSIPFRIGGAARSRSRCVIANHEQLPQSLIRRLRLQ